MTHEIDYTGPIKDTVEHLGKTYAHRGNFWNGYGRWCAYYTRENEQGVMTEDLYAYEKENDNDSNV